MSLKRSLIAALCSLFLAGVMGDGSLTVFTGLGGARTKIASKQSLFGMPHFSGSILAPLYYDADHNPDGCAAYTNLNPASTPGPSTSMGTFVMVIDRGGGCSFTTKVRNAQNAGAAAVIIINNKPVGTPGGGLSIFMSDDGTGSDINIPSMLIAMEDGPRLKTMMQANTVMAQLAWTIPHPDDHVEWSLWTSAADQSSEAFKLQFGRVTAALGTHASFIPRFLIIDGHMFGCTRPGYPCGNQCSNQGRYCAEDPDHDFHAGISGLQVVQENLRQMCIFDYVNRTSGTAQLWWKYAGLWASQCVGFLPNSTTDFTLSCSKTQQLAAGLDPEVTDSCVTQSGGYEFMDSTPNAMMDKALRLRIEKRITLLPSLFINKEAYRGSLACPDPISLSTCPVLNAICAGFPEADKPAACFDSYCWTSLDVCGVCGGDGSSCEGCDGVASSGKIFDPCGVCGGDGSFDACRVCLPGNDPLRDSTCKGCDGVVNSGVQNDACGVCGGDGSFDACGVCYPANDPLRDSTCKGCDGVVNSGKTKDECGVCGGDGSFDQCGRCYAKGNPLRQDDYCRDDTLVDIVQVTFKLLGIDKDGFYEIEQRFEETLAAVFGNGIVADDISVEDIVDGNRRDVQTLHVRLHIRTKASVGATLVSAMANATFSSDLEGALHAAHIDVKVAVETQAALKQAAGKDQDTVMGFSAPVFWTGFSLTIVFLLILIPVLIFGVRKYIAHRNLLQQYERLRMGGDEFPELDMTQEDPELRVDTTTPHSTM